MSEIYDLLDKIKKIIKKQEIMEHLVLARIGLKSKIILDNINQNSTDDPKQIKQLLKAANEVLGTKIK